MGTYNYQKPLVTAQTNLFEGVYAASGATETRCKSIYMLGKPVKPTYNPIEDGYKKGRGCEGCLAWNAAQCVCRLITAPKEMNWDGDFRPSWEVAGHKPDEPGY